MSEAHASEIALMALSADEGTLLGYVDVFPHMRASVQVGWDCEVYNSRGQFEGLRTFLDMDEDTIHIAGKTFSRVTNCGWWQHDHKANARYWFDNDDDSRFHFVARDNTPR